MEKTYTVCFELDTFIMVVVRVLIETSSLHSVNIKLNIFFKNVSRLSVSKHMTSEDFETPTG